MPPIVIPADRDERIERLRAACLALDPEPIAAFATRLLEEWSPPGEEGVMAELVAAGFREAAGNALGATAEVVIDEEIPGSPTVVARLRGIEPGPTMQWHGHLDAIRTPHPPVRREGDRIWGRGACDMKGALAADVTAFRLLREAGLPVRGELLVTFHGLHEEGHSLPLRRLIERGVVGDAVISGELGSGRELVTHGRGLTFWEVEVTRSGDAIHETNAGPSVVNPLSVGHRLLDLISALRDGLAAGTATPRGSLFIGEFTSGDYFNRVPNSARLSGTRRHHSDASLRDIAAQLEGIVEQVRAETGAEISPSWHSLAEAYEIDPATRVARALRRAHHDLTGEAMTAVGSRAVGNAVDFVRRAGVPCVYYGMTYLPAHSDNEWLDVPELARVAGGHALTTAYYLDGADDLAAPDLEA